MTVLFNCRNRPTCAICHAFIKRYSTWTSFVKIQPFTVHLYVLMDRIMNRCSDYGQTSTSWRLLPTSPSVRPSVCLVRTSNSRAKKLGETKICVNIYLGGSNRWANIQFNRSQINHQKPPETDAYIFSRNHGLCGDLIYRLHLRHSATGRTAAYHVGTRRRHLCLYSLSLSFSKVTPLRRVQNARRRRATIGRRSGT